MTRSKPSLALRLLTGLLCTIALVIACGIAALLGVNYGIKIGRIPSAPMGGIELVTLVGAAAGGIAGLICGFWLHPRGHLWVTGVALVFLAIVYFT